MQLFLLEIVAVLVPVYLIKKCSGYYPLPHQALRGLIIWLPPREEAIEGLLPKHHRRQKQRPVEQLQERFKSLNKDVVDVLESQPARISARQMSPKHTTVLMRYLHYETLEMALSVALIAALQYCIASVLACLKGVDTTVVTSTCLGMGLTISIMSLVRIMTDYGWKHPEVKLATWVALFAAGLAWATVAWAPSWFLDAPVEAAFADVTRRIALYVEALLSLIHI